jgi:hypothetical protein
MARGSQPADQDAASEKRHRGQNHSRSHGALSMCLSKATERCIRTLFLRTAMRIPLKVGPFILRT